ncbi:MAG TPA: hypothetical protein VGF79_00445, partial [Bacteroidia bacterium]
NKLNRNISTLGKIESERDFQTELKAIKSKEMTFKRLIKELLSDPIIIDDGDPFMKINLNEYLATSTDYTDQKLIREEELLRLPQAMGSYVQLLGYKMFSLKQKLLNEMAKVLV